MILNKFQFPLYDTDDSQGAATEELTADSIDKLLSEEPEEEEVLELEKPEKEEEPEEKEEEEKEEELKLEEGEEPQELVVPVSKKKILSKYPNLFKDFPYLETAYYADQAYKELLPTIDDAKEVIEKAKVLDGFEQSLLKGDTKQVLTSIKQADGDAFAKIVDNYLPTLKSVDEGAFNHIVSNFTRQAVIAMATTARETGDEELAKAALALNKFAFGTTQVTPPQKLSKEDKEQDDKINQERAQFVQERFSVVKEDLDSRIMNTLKSTIDRHIDPKGVMTDYVKKNAVREALELTDKIIAADKPFRTQLDTLWRQSFERNFNKDTQDRIRSAYLSKVKTVLPQVIAKTRNEAMRGLKSRTTGEPKRGLVNPGRPTQSRATSTDGPKKGERSIDFLMRD